MNSIEERLKDSLTAVAETLPPAAVPAMDFSGRRIAVIPRWLAPVVAAVAVGTVVAGLVALPDRAPHRTAVQSAMVPPLGPAAAPPRYFVGAEVPNPIAVYDTANNKKVSRTSVQGVTRLTGTGDGRTYIAMSDATRAASGWAFYRIRINAAGKVVATTPLSIKVAPGYGVMGLAASRDGTKVALALEHDVLPSQPGKSGQRVKMDHAIEVTDLTAKTTTTWRSAAYGSLASVSMDPAGRTVAFGWQTFGRGEEGGQVRLLDVTSASRDLLSSRVVVRGSRNASVGGRVALSPDGRHVAAATEAGGRPQIVDYPITPGPRPRVLLKGRPGGANEFGILAFDPTGTNLLFEGGGYPVSRLADGKVTTLGDLKDADIESSGGW